MNKHQENLIRYLRDYADYFVETIMARQTEPRMVIDNVFPLVSDFIEISIKREIGQYVPRSAGYERLVDMLIELKITKPDSQLALALLNTINGIYRN